MRIKRRIHGRGIYKLPHKIIQELREEVDKLREECEEKKRWERRWVWSVVTRIVWKRS